MSTNVCIAPAYAYAFVPTGSMYHGQGTAPAPVGADCSASSPVPSTAENGDYMPMADVLRLLGHKLVRRALDMDRKLAVEYIRAVRDRWDGINQEACAALIVALQAS